MLNDSFIHLFLLMHLWCKKKSREKKKKRMPYHGQGKWYLALFLLHSHFNLFDFIKLWLYLLTCNFISCHSYPSELFRDLYWSTFLSYRFSFDLNITKVNISFYFFTSIISSIYNSVTLHLFQLWRAGLILMVVLT